VAAIVQLANGLALFELDMGDGVDGFLDGVGMKRQKGYGVGELDQGWAGRKKGEFVIDGYGVRGGRSVSRGSLGGLKQGGQAVGAEGGSFCGGSLDIL